MIAEGYEVPAIVHPSAIVSPSAVLEAGCFVMQRAVVNTHTRVERAALINSGAVVDHDSVVCAGAHIGLGSVVKANCTIEAGQKVEAGEVIFSTRRKIEGVDSRSLEDAVYAFGFGPQCSYVKPFGEGHINETYAVYMPGQDGKDVPLYVLQRININVFKNPDQVMDNIFGVTEYLRNIIRQDGGDLDRESLSYIKTKSGDTYFEDDQGQPWRCLHYVPNSVCYQQVERPEQFYQSALSFGHFLKQLGDYPAESLYETIPKFHDTVKRFRDFEDAQRKDVKNRARLCRPDLDKVHFDISLYDIYAKGYLEMAKDVLTPAEIESLPWGARLMTLECGMRFLADFLQGDVYFRTAYPEHNLVRARTQFRLVKEMEEQFDEMKDILKKYV